MDENFSFGYWLRRQRLARDLRQDDLATRLGIATVTLRKIEADERRPSLQLIARLAEVFGLDEPERELLQRVARADLSPVALPLPERAPDADPQQPAADVAALPNGTATFLFTDIAGSTRRWEQHPALMRGNLAQHDDLLHTAIARHGGAVVKGTGDGLIAVFAQAADALAAAIDGQRALVIADWGPAGALEVRMALHTGEAHLVDGDYFGPTLNRAARLLGAGHGCQVLLSLATAELLRDRLPSDVQLRDLGVHQLKDLARPEQIVQAVAADLPSAFPPLRTHTSRLFILPTPPNALIGREAELTEIITLLDEPGLRLLTLLGPGGTGKTRLAIQAAHELKDRFADGVCFVDLTPVRDPTLVAPMLGRTLGLQENQGRPMAEIVAAFLQKKELLLILDNCEQVIDAAPDIAALLAAAPQMWILATSREALRVAAERLYLVPPLTVPAAGEVGFHTPAAQLFLARARAGRGEVPLTDTTGAAVASICRRLDGLPLALELAAARLRHLTPQALLERLERPLDLLTSGARDLPTRQQTLRTTIAWSYDLLSKQEQMLFRRLGVFVGGCDLMAAEAVGGLEADTLDVLSGLIDKSLVGTMTGVNNEPRYTMLETIREFALEQLAVCGELKATQERHAAYACALAARAESEEYGTEPLIWLDRLDQEHPNLLAALNTSFAEGAYDRVAKLCAHLRWFWFHRAHFTQAETWIDQMWSFQDQLTSAVRAHFLQSCSYLVSGYERQVEGAATSAALYRNLGDPKGEAWALATLGSLTYFMGDAERSRAPSEMLLSLARKLGDDALLKEALANLGNIRLFDGDLVAARALFEEGLQACRKRSSPLQLSDLLGYVGHVAEKQGDYAQAQRCFTESAALRRSIGDGRGTAVRIMEASEVALRQGDILGAKRLLSESMAVFRDIGWSQGVGWAHHTLVLIAHSLGDQVRAARLLGAEEMIRAAVGYAIWPDLLVEFEHLLSITQEALGAETYSAAFAAGRSLTVEAAVAEALEWLAEALE